MKAEKKVIPLASSWQAKASQARARAWRIGSVHLATAIVSTAIVEPRRYETMVESAKKNGMRLWM